MNNLDDEKTRFGAEDNDATQYESTEETQYESEMTPNQNDDVNEDEVEVKDAKPSLWKRAAIGGGAGLLIGGVATMLMGMKKADEPEPDKNDENATQDASRPDWADDEIPIASSVNDDMSFGEAFAAARAEVGAGGAFEWHGQVYGTFTAAEWNAMSPAEKAEYGDHFSWNKIDQSESDVAQHSNSSQLSSHSPHSSHDHAAENVSHTQPQSDKDDDIEVITSDHHKPGQANHSAEQNNHTEQNQNTDQHQNSEQGMHPMLSGLQNEGHEVEVLGVIHDDASDANLGAMKIDGQDVILIDVDNDLSFDVMASDLNHNNKVDPGEALDIQDQHITVADLGGILNAPSDSYNPTGDVMANNDDFSNDIPYEG